MHGQHAPNILNRFDECSSKLLHLKMCAHSFYNVLPELFAAFLMNRLIANNGELVHAGRDKNQNCITLTRLVHAEPTKLLLRRKKRITLQLAALDQNANLTGSFRFRFANRLDDSVVLEFGEEFSRTHLVSPARARAASAETAAAATKSAESAAIAATGRPASASGNKNRATSTG